MYAETIEGVCPPQKTIGGRSLLAQKPRKSMQKTLQPIQKGERVSHRVSMGGKNISRKPSLLKKYILGNF